eukprot:CAMPEP_0177612960 /NCGR_PEP_ID=MMETSP0419_2-20121207/21617_1 /TAXON_ID=582737 /ORGANISM="Tetraselmis sp., Strain GSL018" /LENGTH=262 /DNA_ID=CAMNT_0019109419 /DNA_START=304 /DNA_END=1089 /DNA_ORIENTATION=-
MEDVHRLDEEAWEMHKVRMGHLRGLKCDGVGYENHRNDFGEAYARAPLDSARDMHDVNLDSGGFVFVPNGDSAPVDEYGVALLETIPEKASEVSTESSKSTELSLGTVNPTSERENFHTAKPKGSSRVRTLGHLEELMAPSQDTATRAASIQALNDALRESLSRDSQAITGPDGSFWPIIVSRKYADVRKHNWTQTDEDKDLTTARGIHSTVDFISRGLDALDKALESVKREVRTGKRESMEQEIREIHRKYRSQAQWEADK